MKKVMGIIAVCAVAVSTFYVPAFAATKTVTGTIMDSQCALQGGKHDNMIRVGQDEAACTKMCIGLGGSYVLYDDATKTTYKLDDQKKPVAFAGQKVSITGDLNDATKSIKAYTIKKG